MENTLENKKRFFALYETQEIAKSSKSAIPHIVSAYFVMGHHYLELKPLSMISHEELSKCLKILGTKPFDPVIDKELFDDFKDSFIEGFKNKEFYGTFYPYRVIELIDHLRSKGYVLPWMGLSVEKLQKYGWIKLNK